MERGKIVLYVIEFIRCQPQQCLTRPPFNTFSLRCFLGRLRRRLGRINFLYLYKNGMCRQYIIVVVTVIRLNRSHASQF